MAADKVGTRGRILICDDQYLIVEFLRVWIEAFGFEVCGVANSGSGAIELAQKLDPDIVIMDVHIAGDMDGIDAAARLVGHTKARIIFCTGAGETSVMKRITSVGAFATLIKPIDPQELGLILSRV